MRKTGSQTKEIDQKDKTHTGKTQGHQKEPKHQEPDKSPEWKQSLRYSQECKNTYNQTHELYHYRSDTVQVWINVLIRYWKKNTKKKSQEESHGDDWFRDPIKKAMNDFNSGKH